MGFSGATRSCRYLGDSVKIHPKEPGFKTCSFSLCKHVPFPWMMLVLMGEFGCCCLSEFVCKKVAVWQRDEGNWWQNGRKGLSNASELDFIRRWLNFYCIFMSNACFSIQRFEKRETGVLGCFKSKWTELPGGAWFTIHGLSYMTLLLQVEKRTTIIFNTGMLWYVRIDII